MLCPHGEHPSPGSGRLLYRFVLTPWLLGIMAVPGDIYHETLAYCRIYFAGIWAMVMYNMMAGILRALGDSRRPLYVLILSSLLNIVGDFPLVGVFHMGVQGAAIATVAAQVISVLPVSSMIKKIERISDGKSVMHIHFCPEHMGAMVKTGIPLALQSILFPIANSVVQASVNGMGTDSIAAWGICDKMDLLIWLIADAMSPALTTYTAQNLGANQPGRVKKGVLLGTAMSVGSVALVSLALYLGADFIGNWFVPAADAVLPCQAEVAAGGLFRRRFQKLDSSLHHAGLRHVRQVHLSGAYCQLNQDYVTGARARGVAEWKILWLNVLPNSLLPLITMLSLSLGPLLGGTAVVEVIFTYPGLGNLAISAITAYDYPLIQGYVLWISLIYILVNLAVDISFSYVDPRMREKR